MTHKILLWLCGLASVLGIVLYLIDKFTPKKFSLRLTVGLVSGGVIVAIILAFTEQKSESLKIEHLPQESNEIKIRNNKNSPVSSKVERQTNNYYFGDTTKAKGTKDQESVQKRNENIAESADQKDGVTANKLSKHKSKDVVEDNHIPIVNKVTSINQQGGITANEVHIYEKEREPELTRENLDLLFQEVLELRLPSYYPEDRDLQVATMLHGETLMEFKRYEKKGWLTITSTASMTNMGAGNRVGNSIEDKKRPWGMGNGYIIKLNRSIYDN